MRRCYPSHRKSGNPTWLNTIKTIKIEEAIKFLVFTVQESGMNPKPVILHSIRVWLNLQNLGYDKDVVVAAILHDILEDQM